MNQIRKMLIEDISAVCKIEKECFSTPWSKESFKGDLANPNSHYYVYVKDGIIIGYAGFWAVLDEAGITNIAICKKEQGKGYGKELTAFILERAAKLGLAGVTLEVRQSNAVAISMYQKHGFEVAGIRKDYYSKPMENALIMWVTIKKEESHEHGTKSN